MDSQIQLTKEADQAMIELAQHCKDMRQNTMSGDFEAADRYRDCASADCSRILDILGRLSFNDESLKALRSKTFSKIKMGYTEELETFKCLIPGRLPHRIKDTNDTAAVNELIDYKEKIAESFKEYFEKHTISFDRRVDIVIRSHYNDMKRMMDYDNAETKPIIDAIARNMLVDDNPMCCRLILDATYDAGGKEYVEVTVKYCKNDKNQ